jgi:poly[(R)-3-hydroxyalkanoate] polymerase subunit PhaC
METSVFSPNDLAARIRRDVERTVLRAKNGIKYVAGVGRPAVGASPKDTVWSRDKVQLWRYHSDARRFRPPLFLVMSLVSRSYILDLRPGSSMVEDFLAAGFDVFCLDWGIPDEVEAGNTLETYCNEYLPRAVAAACAEAGSDGVTMLGYCFGGILALIYTAAHPGPQVRNLISAATPFDSSKTNAFPGLLNEGRLEPEELFDETGNVPPEVIVNGFQLARPTAQLASYANLWENLWNDEFFEAYQVVDGWARDQIPFPGACFAQTTRMLARENRLAEGTMRLDGRRISLKKITCPFLNVIAERDHLAPIEAAAPLTAAVGSKDVEELRIDAGHVGLFIGRSSRKVTMPKVIDWMRRHSDAH